MAKGSRGGSGGNLLGRQGEVGNVSNIRDLVSERGRLTTETDDVLSVGRRMTGLYGDDTAVTQFQIARMSGALAYYI